MWSISIKRGLLVSLAAGGVFFVAVTCNMIPFIPTTTPIPTRIPVGAQNDTVPLSQTPPTSVIPNETASVGDTLSTSTASPPESASKPTSTPVGELEPGTLLPTLEAGELVTITYIHMVTSEDGWGVGNAGSMIDRILRTHDGGESWLDVSLPIAGLTAGEIRRAEAFFLDGDTAWVTYQPYEKIWFTKDGGKTWGVSSTGYAGYIGAMFWFTDQDYGWLMIFIDAGMSHVYTTLVRTTTGGENWEMIVDPTANDELQAFNKTGMVFVDGNNGWVTRDSGGVQPGAFIDVTEDGGITWQSFNLPPPEDYPKKFDQEYCRMHSPTLFSEAHGALIVDCVGYQGDEKTESAYMFTTRDGAHSWEWFDYPGGQINFIDQRIAFALDREIYRTQDGGLTWEQVKRVEWDGQFSFVDENLAWVVARDGDAIALVKTEDGGKTWELLEPEIRSGAD